MSQNLYQPIQASVRGGLFCDTSNTSCTFFNRSLKFPLIFPLQASVENPLKKGFEKGTMTVIVIYKSVPVPFFGGYTTKEGFKKNTMTRDIRKTQALRSLGFSMMTGGQAAPEVVC